jgi:LysW-gamma-L-lysine carboxypeptidase
MNPFRLSLKDQASIVPFLRNLVQTPSLSTQEEAVAERIAVEMERLGFRDVRTDRIGNVVGWIGPGRGPVLMLNGHMDTVWDPAT